MKLLICTRQLLPVLLITLLFLFRIFVFVGNYGGIEHDSGWYLGVAKNLALRGIYASYTNTVVSEGHGAYPSIHQRYSVQDANGYVYFPAGVTVGPGYIIPEAIVIHLFGSGWWQYRTWPLLAFSIMLLLTLYIVWRIGGLLSLLLFSFWLWLIPQMYIQFAYESYGEDIAFLFLLLGFYLLYLTKQSGRSLWISFLAGISLAFSYLTKTLFILPIAGIVVFAVWDYIRFKAHKKYLLLKWVLIAAGAVLPVLLFNYYEYSYVIAHFGKVGWQAIQEDNRLVYLTGGSGLNLTDLKIALTPIFLSAKFNIWVDIGSNFPIALWLLFLLSPFVFLRYLKIPEKVFLSGLYVAALLSFLWYVFLSTDGWARHVWQGLILGQILICICIGLVQKHYQSEQKKIIWIMLGAVMVIFANYAVLSIQPVLPASIIQTWAVTRSIRGIEYAGFPSTAIFSLSDEEGVMNFFNNTIIPSDRVYYLSTYLVAEVPPLVDHVFYPFGRYLKDKQRNPEGGKSYLIIGPYQKGFWSLVPSNYPEVVVKELCQNVVFDNPSYMICILKQHIVLK